MSLDDLDQAKLTLTFFIKLLYCIYDLLPDACGLSSECENLCLSIRLVISHVRCNAADQSQYLVFYLAKLLCHLKTELVPLVELWLFKRVRADVGEDFFEFSFHFKDINHIVFHFFDQV